MFPVEILDQSLIWIDPTGLQWQTSTINNENVLLWAIDYLLANSRFLRETWSTKTQQTYDIEQRARRWMLDKPLTKALMKRLVELWQAVERKQAIQEAFDDRSVMEQSKRSTTLDNRG